MKNKKYFKFLLIFLLVLSALFFSYYIYYSFTKLHEESFVSDDFLYVCRTENVFNLFKRLNETRLLNTVFGSKDLKEVYEILTDVKAGLTGAKKTFLPLVSFPITFVLYDDNNISLVFNPGLKAPLFRAGSFAVKSIYSDSKKFRIVKEKYNEFTVYKLSMLSRKKDYYFVQIRNLILFSPSLAILKKNIDTFLNKKGLDMNENYLQVKAQISKKGLLTVYYNPIHILNGIKEKNPKLYNNLKTLSILSIAGSVLEIEKDFVKISGFFSTDIKDEQILKLFQSSPKRLKNMELLPVKTGSFAALTFNDFQDVWNCYNRILIKTGQQDKQAKIADTQKAIDSLLGLSLKEQLFSWINDEIAVSYMEGFSDPLVFINVRSLKNFKNTIAALNKKDILNSYVLFDHKGVSVNQIKFSPTFKLISGLFADDLPSPFYILYDDYIILSENKDLILFFTGSLKENNDLFAQEKIKLLYSGINKGNVTAYWDLSKTSSGLLKANNIFSRIIEKYNYGMVSLEFADKGIKNTVFITEPRKTMVKTVDGWPAAFDSSLWASPIAYNIDNKNLDEIIMGTEDGKIYIYDFFGEILPGWPVKMKSLLKNRPFIILQPGKKDVLIGAVSCGGTVYLWEKDGSLKGEYEALKNTVNYAPIVEDINEDGIPDIIIANDKGQVSAIDINGKLLPGFPVQLDKNAESRMALMINGHNKKPELVCSQKTPDGALCFINNTGTVWDEMKLSTGSLNFSEPVITEFRKGEPEIALLTVDGKLFRWNKKGESRPNYPVELMDKFINPPVIEDINKDNKKEMLCISAAGKLYCLSDTGEILFEMGLNFKPIENEKIIILDINGDNEKELIIPGADNFIRFFDLSGVLLFKVTGVTAPFIKDMDMDGKLEVLTAGDDSKAYLYKLP